MTDYSDTIRRARERRKLTLHAVAKVLGVSVPYLSDVELGKRGPFSEDRNGQIAATLGLDAAYLEVLATTARGWVDVSGLSAKRVGHVLALVRKLRGGE